MHRLQISLTPTQYEFLKSEAFVVNKSMAAVLRELLDDIIQQRHQETLAADPLWQAIGIGQEIDGPTDVSQNVDKYLYGERMEMSQTSSLPRVAEEPDEYDTD